jgi:hypothetical protein
VVDDRGYHDDRLFAQWTQKGIYCVTRRKDHALYQVVARHPVPENRHVLKDQTIRLTGSGRTLPPRAVRSLRRLSEQHLLLTVITQDERVIYLVTD